MKTTSFVGAAFVASLLVGCADNSSPLQADSSAGTTALSRSGDNGSADRAADRSGRVEGTVHAVDIPNGLVTIGSTVVKTNASTKIERNGYHATLSQFKIGDRGQERYNPGASVAWKVEATSM